MQVDPDRFFLAGTEGNLRAEPLNGDRLVIRTNRGEYDEHHPPPTNLNAPLMARGKNANADDVLSMTVLLEAVAQGNVALTAAHLHSNVALVVSKPTAQLGIRLKT